MNSKFLIVGFVTVCSLVGLESIAAYVGANEPVEALDDLVIQDRKQVVRGEEKFDILFLGDSTASTSIVPSLFERETGKSAYNLGTYLSANLIADIALLKEYLSRSSAPEAVIVVHSLLRWYHHPDDMYLNTDFPDLGIAWEWYRTGQLSLSDFSKVVPKRLIPSFRYRDDIRENIHRVFTNGQQEDTVSYLPREEIRKARGYIPSWENAGSSQWSMSDLVSDLEHGLGTGSLVVPMATDVLIRRLCRIGEKYGTSVYIAMSPIPSAAVQIGTTQRALSSAWQYLEVLEQQERGCSLLTERPVLFDYAGTENVFHPSRESAEQYTQRIAELYNQFVQR